MPKAEVQRLFEMIHNVRRQGVGILYVSHHLEEVFELSDRVTPWSTVTGSRRSARRSWTSGRSWT